MGKIEKLVVLTVLFLSAVVVAVSLNEDGEAGADGAAPLSAANERLREGKEGQQGEQAGDAGRGFLLDASGAPQPPAADESKNEPRELEPRSPESLDASAPGGRVALLTNETGLTVSGLDEYRIYRVEQDGEAWDDLSQRFYGDRDHVALLRTANEELERLQKDDRILVPVYDLEREAVTRDPYRPARPRAQESAEGEEQAVAADDARPGGSYVVRDGDNLSRIAKAVYGSTNRWEDIYEANKDVLADPDTLDVGVRLKLPK